MDHRGEDLIKTFKGLVRRVRIVPVVRRPKKKEFLLFYGRVDQLEWDPKRYMWN